MANSLYYGDNLAVQREHVADESVEKLSEQPRAQSPNVATGKSLKDQEIRSVRPNIGCQNVNR